MQERYSRLYTLDANQYTQGSPVIIAAGALLLDRNNSRVLAQLKIRNISRKQILALRIKLTCYDIERQIIGTDLNFQFLDLMANRDDEFGQNTPIYLPDNTTRSFAIQGLVVFFADESKWQCDVIDWKILNLNSSLEEYYLNNELVIQYRLETTPQSKFVPIDASDIWFCTCGYINGMDESRCHNCGLDHKQVLCNLSKDFLNTRIEQRAKLQQEERERNAILHYENNKKKRKNFFKWLFVSIGTLALIFVIIILYLNLIKPEIQYKKALFELENENFSVAYSLFLDIQDYKDSEVLASKAMESIEVQIDHNQWKLSDYEYEGQLFSDVYVCDATSQRKDSLLVLVNFKKDTEAWKNGEYRRKIISKYEILTLSNGKGVIRETVNTGDEIVSPLFAKGYLLLSNLGTTTTHVTIENTTISKEDFIAFWRNAYLIQAEVKTSVQEGLQLLAYAIVDKSNGVVQTAYCLIVNGTAKIHERFALPEGVLRPSYEIVPIAIYDFKDTAKNSFKYSCSNLIGEVNSIGSYEGSITINSTSDQTGMAIYRLEIYDGSKLINPGALTTVLFDQGVGVANVYISDINKSELDYKIYLIAFAPFISLEQ